MSTAKPDYLPQHTQWHAGDSAIELAQDLANAVAECLRQALATRPRASLAVSGGRTPTTMFAALSQEDLEWQRVDITLVDERWVDEHEVGSNAALVRAHLLQNAAASANFIPMYNGAASNTQGCQACHEQLQAIARPVDVMILGMGNDGHTASLFPQCPNLAHAMATDNPLLCNATRAPVEPTQRITWTGQQIHLARHKFLHLVGNDKLTTLQQAMHLRSPSKMPIFAFLQRPISIYWSA
ncbi:MAG: 6-phosphogluconolactonase [Gammaproteobacteria bacterium]|jgi:6-phosphogluconolactonase|nr:6-phosphogluconolactonase [Gammaproteobacteria bacterium]